jgi:hypothetical protein
MNVERFHRSLAACAVLMALAAFGCGDNRDAGTDRDAALGEVKDGAPITVAGCLQKGDDDFILTEANTPAGSVGTTGTAGEANEVEGEQRKAASRSYRLSGNDDRLGDLVGHQVRISGKVADEGDVANNDRDRGEIKEGDLAQLEVSSVESIANTCSGSAPRP